MKLPFVKSKDNDTNGGPQKPGFWKSLDWKLMLALVLPVTLEMLDYTVVATAQSRIASVFDALPLESYIGTSYLLTSTVFLPFFAAVADIYGRHFGLQISLLLFLLGSALSTGAVNMPMVLAGRGIAGVGAAGLLTIVRTVMLDTESLNTNNFQQSMLFLLYCVGFTVGPFIGGLLVATNFRWVFGINLPCTALAMLLCFLFLRNRVRDAKEGGNLPSNSRADTWLAKLVLIDWIGTFLFISGGILILLALNWGPDDNWKSARVIANVVIGGILIILCLIWEIVLERKRLSPSGETGIYRAYPAVPIEMFTSYDICVTQYGSFVSGIVMFVMFYFVAIFAIIVTGLPPAQAGIQLLYFAPGLGCGSLISIRMIKIFRQPIYPIVLGSVIMTVGVGFIQMAMQRNIQGEVDGFMAMVGVGVGLTAGPVVIHARFTKPDHVAITNAMLLFFRSLGGTVGLAQCFTVMNAKVNTYISNQISSGALSGSDLAALVALFNSGGLTSVTSLDGLPTGLQTVIRDAFRNAVRWSFISLIPWLGLAAVLSVFLSKIPDSDLDAERAANSRSTDVEMTPQTRGELDTGSEARLAERER
ncbi:MFS general substrate transporter [Paxillus ammoniavirescens]|nr:MFS general substrate transporter [Paxillus ammoniavirescens]